MRRRRIAAALGATLFAGLLLSGCGADGSDDSGSATAPAVAQRDAAGKAAPAEGNATQGEDTSAQAPDLRVDQRSIVYTGSLTVRVQDVAAAAARASGIASAAGGFVGSDERHSGTDSDDATLTLRVPADKFTSVVDQLSRLGTEELRGISTEDVTEQVVDLDARIAVQQARVDSGRKLLARARSLNDLVLLEREVATRESDLASLQAKKRRLADLTALSTITVVLLDPEAKVADDQDDGPAGFLGGLRGGWNALLASLAVVLTVLGALLPWTPVAAALGAAWIWIRRRRRATRGVLAPTPAVVAEAPKP